MMDNDSKHKAKYTQTELNEDGVLFGFIPSLSPDLNPIEKVWARLDAVIAQNPPKSINLLKRLVTKEWWSLSVPYLDSLISKLPEICTEVIHQNGGNSKY